MKPRSKHQGYRLERERRIIRTTLRGHRMLARVWPNHRFKDATAYGFGRDVRGGILRGGIWVSR